MFQSSNTGGGGINNGDGPSSNQAGIVEFLPPAVIIESPKPAIDYDNYYVEQASLNHCAPRGVLDRCDWDNLSPHDEHVFSHWANTTLTRNLPSPLSLSSYTPNSAGSWEGSLASPSPYTPNGAGSVDRSPASLSPYTPNSADSWPRSPAVASPDTSWDGSHCGFPEENGANVDLLTSGGPAGKLMVHFNKYAGPTWQSEDTQPVQFIGGTGFEAYHSSSSTERVGAGEIWQSSHAPLSPPTVGIYPAHHLPKPLDAVPRPRIGTLASRDATLRRRKVNPGANLFYCSLPDCGQSFTRKKNLTS